ncbi:hypothetical protein [Streptomyces sp. NPDC001889]
MTPITAVGPARTAVERALAAGGHDVGELLVRRPAADADHLVVCFNPYSSDNWSEEEAHHAAYAATLRNAGWAGALDLGRLVLVPSVPVTETGGSYTVTWQTTVTDAPGVDEAAAQAREQQLDPEITEAYWTVTDPLGRAHTVATFDS